MSREKRDNEDEKPVNYGSTRSIFMHADRVDMGLMAVGFIGAVADGFCARVAVIFIARMLNNIGSNASRNKVSDSADNLQHSLNKVTR